MISVKDEKSKFGTVLGLILNDLHNHPHRAKRSVISLSRSWNLRWNQGAANNDSAREVYLKPLKEILDLGVPFVVSGGNWAKKSTFVERFPQVLASDEIPLIVVGAATSVITDSLLETNVLNAIQDQRKTLQVCSEGST